MPCLCGSAGCVCQGGCFCNETDCKCSKCSSLLKMCPRCNLPYATTLKDVTIICLCKTQELSTSSAHSNLQSQEAAMSAKFAEMSIEKEQCIHCGLPVQSSTKEDIDSVVDSCCCSSKKTDSNTPVTSTEHETSNCTSDHREVLPDRLARKALSRKTRTEQSNWQSKKAKGKKYSSNSAEEDSGTEIADEEFLDVALSCSPVEDIPERDSLLVDLAGSMTSDSNLQNINFDSSTQSQTGFYSKTEDTSISGNLSSPSLFVNTSGISSPSTSKDFSNSPDFFGFLLSTHNVRPKLPPPFPRLPNPIPGPPAFGGSGGRFSPLHPRKSLHAFQPALLDQPVLERAEKMEIWFETIGTATDGSGELPDAEAAAAIDREEKVRLEQQNDDQSDELLEEIPDRRREQLSPKKSRRMPRYIPTADVSKNGQEQDVIDPTTDTERSSTLSKSHKESESD